MAELKQGLKLLRELSNERNGYFLDPDPLVDSIMANGQHPATCLVGDYKIRYLPFHYSDGNQGILVAVAASECSHALPGKCRSTIFSLTSDVSVRSIEDLLQHSYLDTRTPLILSQAYFVASGNEAEAAFKKILLQAIHFSAGYRQQRIATAGGLAHLLETYRKGKSLHDGD